MSEPVPHDRAFPPDAFRPAVIPPDPARDARVAARRAADARTAGRALDLLLAPDGPVGASYRHGWEDGYATAEARHAACPCVHEE